MESNNLLIGYKHGKKIYVIGRFVTSDYERELSHVCGYTWALDLTWVRKGLFVGALHSKIQFITHVTLGM
jgi:predicted Mrr-cat superfamily restriction endonuclease